MPNIKSSEKRVLTSAKKTMNNTSAKSELKTTIKKTKTAIAEGNATVLTTAYKAIDQAAAKNLIHKNTAARKKSQLAKAAAKLNKE